MPVAVADPSLAERVHAGDAQAFGTLYTEYAPAVHDFLARMVHDRAAAEDLTQATFIAAFEHRSTLRDSSKIKSWLWSTAHNQAVNYLTRQRKSDSLDERFDLATMARGPEESAEAKDAAELVWLAAASLEPRQYALLDLTVRRDLSTPEVAEALGIPVGHASVLVNRAREALGNAVRYLLVARRREQCEQLAALVPAGVRSLTPEQRSTVDHHMRRCEQCRELGDRLTAPAELLGALVLLPTPAQLAQLDIAHVIGTAQVGSAAHGAGRWFGRKAAHRATRAAGQNALASGIQVIVSLAVAVAITVPQAGSKASPSSPAVLAGSGLQAQAGSGGTANPSASGTSRTNAGPGGPGTAAGASDTLIAVADFPTPVYPGPTGLEGGFTTQPLDLELLRPDGTLANTLSLKSGIRILGVAGGRIFVLESGDVLKSVRADGTTENLGQLVGPVTTFIADSSGNRWLWTNVQFASGGPISDVYSGGVGRATHLLQHLSDVNWQLLALAWTPGGPVVIHFPFGIGGPYAGVSPTDYVSQADVYDPDHGVIRTLPGTSPQASGVCRFTDLRADGAFACIAYGTGPTSLKPVLRLVSPNGTARTVPLPKYQTAGEAYFAPDGNTLTLVGISGMGVDPTGAFQPPVYELDLVDVRTGMVRPVALPGARPAIRYWLPNGSLVAYRRVDPTGKNLEIYVITSAGQAVRLTTTTGFPIGLIRSLPAGSPIAGIPPSPSGSAIGGVTSSPATSGYATANQAAQAAADALANPYGAGGPAASGVNPWAPCTFQLGTPTYGVSAAVFAGGITCPSSAAAVYTYVYTDSNRWYYYDARDTNGPFVPAIGQTGNLQVSTCVRVRETPGLSGRVLGCIGTGSGTTVNVDGGPTYVDQKLWWHLQGLGWMVHDYLICARPGPSDGLLPAQC